MENEAFFFAQGSPADGKWIDMDTISTVRQVHDELEKQGVILQYDTPIIRCADDEGLAKEFIGAGGVFNFDNFVKCRDLIRAYIHH